MKLIPDYRVHKFLGLNTKIKDLKAIPKGFSPDALNWITSQEKDSISLRRGTHLLGATRNTGSGKITGLGVGTKFNGTQIPFLAYGRTIKYYDATADDTVEVGSSLLPAAANGDTVSIAPYENLAGSFVYISSINSSIYKIPTANPGSSVDQATTYKGFLKFGQSRSFLFNCIGTGGVKDQIGLYGSYVDKTGLAQYPAQITGEAVGSSGSAHYTYTLTQRTGVRTVFKVAISASVAAGTETFTDDNNGVLTSNLGGTGTVNYATGAIDVTFSAVTTGAVTASYYYEDATSTGIADFSIATSGSPATRTEGSGRYFPQFDGGGILNSVYPLTTTFYCFHQLKAWQVQIPTDDNNDSGTNLPFRDKMGVASPFGAFGGQAAIYYMNTANPAQPEFFQLELYTGATQANIAKPKLLSKLMDFSPFAFDVDVVFEWGDYALCSCQQVRNGVADAFNSRTFLRNKKTGIWDMTDIPASVLAEYMGTLLSGDPLTNNVFTLFSGFDDDDNYIPNYYTSGKTNLDMPGQKRFTKMVIEGLIQTSQSGIVSLSFDGGEYVDVFILEGDGSYVDTTRSIDVGSYTTGSKVAGGGSTVLANPFQVEFTVQSPRFEYVQFRLQATGGGYIQLNEYKYKSIRYKGMRVLPSRTV